VPKLKLARAFGRWFRERTKQAESKSS